MVTQFAMPPITLRYSERLIRQAIWAFLWRSTGFTFVIAACASLACCIYLLASGERSLWVGLLGGVIGVMVVIVPLVYLSQYRTTISRFRRMGSKEATFEIGEDRFRMSSDLGSTELAWSAICKVWRFRGFWLLFYSAAQYSIIPIHEMDDATKTAILERARAHGASIV